MWPQFCASSIPHGTLGESNTSEHSSFHDVVVTLCFFLLDQEDLELSEFMGLLDPSCMS